VSKDGKILQEAKDSTRKATKFKQEVLEKDPAKMTFKLRRTYEKAQFTGKDGKLKDEIYQGKTVLIEKKDGKVTASIEGGESLSAATAPRLFKEFTKDDDSNSKMEQLLPKTAVKVGETWKIDPAVMKELLKGGLGETDFSKA